jgi:ABC-type transporter Mla subunit MlaD
MTDDLRTRLEAVERAVTDGEADLSTLDDAATLEERLTAVEERLDTLDARVADLDATTQAVRGYLSGVDGVTDDVERQAALALAKAERVEEQVFEADDGLSVERLPATDESAAEGALSDGPSADRPGATERQASASSVVSRLRDAL